MANAIYTDTVTNISSITNSATGVVKEKFDQASNLANNAWTQAEAFLNALAAAAVFSSITVPDIPVIDYSTIVPTLESIQGEQPTAPEDSSLSMTGIDDLFTVEEIEALGTGLGADVENAIWERAKSRMEIDNLQKYTEAETYFSSRGFDLPPGALSGRLMDVLVEIARNESYLNNDIMVEQARLAFENRKVALNYSIEKYKAQVMGEASRIESIVKVWLGKVEAYKAQTGVTIAYLELEIKNFLAKVEQAKMQSDAILKRAEITMEDLRRVQTIQVEVVKAGAQILAQMTASALSSVNASAQIGVHAQASESVDAGDRYSNSTSTNYDYNF